LENSLRGPVFQELLMVGIFKLARVLINSGISPWGEEVSHLKFWAWEGHKQDLGKGRFLNWGWAT